MVRLGNRELVKMENAVVPVGHTGYSKWLNKVPFVALTLACKHTGSQRWMECNVSLLVTGIPAFVRSAIAGNTYVCMYVHSSSTVYRLSKSESCGELGGREADGI
jgi:hypothetical protein